MKNVQRLHLAGAILFLFTGVAHALGQFLPGPLDPGSAAVIEVLRGFQPPDRTYSFWGLFESLGALYGATTFLFGVLLLTTARASGHDPRVLRATAMVGAVAAIAQSVIGIAFSTWPPVFFMLPAAGLFAFVATNSPAHHVLAEEVRPAA
jgi:hypothetical protein